MASETVVSMSQLSTRNGYSVVGDDANGYILTAWRPDGTTRISSAWFDTRDRAVYEAYWFIGESQRAIDAEFAPMPSSDACPNCDDGCKASIMCDGCEQTICIACWREHNEDAPCHLGDDDDDAANEDRARRDAMGGGFMDRSGNVPSEYEDGQRDARRYED